MNRSETQQFLENCYTRYHRPEYLEIDPLSRVRSCSNMIDQEFVALLSALFAFGGVKQILASIDRAMICFNSIQPSHHALTELPAENYRKAFRDFRHRVYVGDDVVSLLALYQNSKQEFGGLRAHFESKFQTGDSHVGAALEAVIHDYKTNFKKLNLQHGKQFLHLLSSPKDKSTCKRWLMFLKWMIRPNDGIDLGLWNESKCLLPKHLLIPLDVHLFRIAKKLRFTKRMSPNWGMVLEVTEKLRAFDFNDPTRFDFSLCRYGMLKVGK